MVQDCIKQLQNNIIDASIMTGKEKGPIVFKPRIPLISNRLPFTFKRLQFQLNDDNGISGPPSERRPGPARGASRRIDEDVVHKIAPTLTLNSSLYFTGSVHNDMFVESSMSDAAGRGRQMNFGDIKRKIRNIKKKNSINQKSRETRTSIRQGSGLKTAARPTNISPHELAHEVTSADPQHNAEFGSLEAGSE
ncbi:hypothetical protein EVAR_57205_1 [Eumeta japonica]|uniref:Uncharacterized protein n=1 Tax=Eumeta variegata TaxID=151549 RepID=A0A4C1Z116_EUMVA|nr:hypothetical protein EVAR_57205_1 [Eumeta japonica]